MLLGAAVLTGLCCTFGASGVSLLTEAATRDLPIYCVDKTEKVCSLTFDAAWGNDTMRKSQFFIV